MNGTGTNTAMVDFEASNGNITGIRIRSDYDSSIGGGREACHIANMILFGNVYIVVPSTSPTVEPTNAPVLNNCAFYNNIPLNISENESNQVLTSQTFIVSGFNGNYIDSRNQTIAESTRTCGANRVDAKCQYNCFHLLGCFNALFICMGER